MKKLSIRAISLVLCVAMLVGYIVLPDMPAVQAETEVTTTLGPNLIANGTFGGLSSSVITYPKMAMPAGWAIGGNTNTPDIAYLQVTNEYVQNGQYAMKLVDSVDDKAISAFQNITAITPDDAGTGFTASFYGKGSGTVTLALECYTSDTSFTTSGASKTLIKTISKVLTMTDAWTQYTLTNTIPDGTETVRFKITTKKADITEMYIDNAWFSLDGVNTNMLTNESFETLPDATPEISGSTGGADTTGWGGLDTSTIFSIVADDRDASNMVLKLADESTTAGGYVYYTVQATAGTYSLKMDYNTANAPSVYVRSDKYDSTGTQLFQQNLSGTNGAWGSYETTVEVPADGEIYILINSANGPTNTAYFDNIFFAKVTTTGGNQGGSEGGNEGGSTTPVTGNLISNGTFGTNAADVSGWNGLDTSKVFSVIADPDKAENFILKMVDESTTSGGYIYPTIEAAVGVYKLKLEYKTDDAPQVLVRANAATSAGEQLLKYNLPATNGAWATYEATIAVTADMANINILLVAGGATVCTAYFDNISFEFVSAGGNEGGEGEGGTVAPEDVIKIPEQNLMGNPFFELTMYTYVTPLTPETAPNGWTLEVEGTGVQVFKTNKSAHKGEWSIQAVDTSATGYFKLSYKVENIVAGQEYQYIYARQGEGSPGMFIRYYDAEGNLLQEYNNCQSGYSNWRESRKLALAPEGTSYAIVSLESNAAKKCNMYLDGVSFYSSEDTLTNLLTNRSFEEYPEGLEDILVSAKNESTLKGWTYGSGADKITLEATTTELDKKSVGNYMIKIDDQMPTGGANMYYTMDVESGKTYTYSAMVRGEYSVNSPSIRLAYYYDEDCKQPAYIGKSQYKSMSIECAPGFWTRGTVSAQAPEGVVKARVYLISANAAVGTAYFGNLAVVEGIPTKFGNLDFEDLDANGAMLKWDSYEDAKIAPYTKDSFAGKMSLQIKDNSEAEQQGAVSLMTDLSGYQKSGLSVEQLMYYLTARVKDAKNVKAQLTIVYYDNGFKEVHRDSVLSAGTGKWQFLRLDSQHAANAAYAQILVTVGDKASAKGTIYLDDITIGGEYVDLREDPYDWQIKEDEGNRLYFTDEELVAIREFAKDDTLNAFGASGANAYRGLMKEADGYITAPYFYSSWDASPDGDRVTLYKVYLDHIQDYSTDPLLADVPGGRNWPYGEGISNGIYTRVSTVAMAYALTGDAKYAQKAIGWAMDICGWEYWCDTKYCWPSAYNGTLGAPRIMRSVAVVYDMCYDQLTQEQKDIMVQNIIHKGMIPLCQDLDAPKVTFHNKYMARCVGIITAGAAIINEENKAEVGRYMDKAYAFCTAFTDNRYETDDNEGYSYTRMSTDDMLIAMDCARRATGRNGLLEHPYFTEVLIDWVCDFVAPITHEWPVYGDSYASGFFKPTMLILNRAFGIGEAGYFLQTVGMGNDNFNTLVYGAYDPVITPPDENDYVVYAERVGYGGLRTGWEDDSIVFYIMGNNSKLGHGHFDQLSFMMTTDGLWPALDPGYSNLTSGFDEQQGHNIMLVDGQWQTVRGEGELHPIVDGQLYGQFEGSAPGAYLGYDENGKLTVPLLTQWDRNAIMINHGDRPYYIVIDEIADDNEHVYDFNLNTGGWTDITVDGKPMAEGVNKGNKVAVYGNQGYLFVEYVSKEKMNIEAVTYEDGGPVIQADSGSKKSAQYMTILTKPYGIEMDEKYSFLPLLNTPELVSYKTSSYDATIIKSVNGGGTPLFFFRGEKAGDWIELPFTVEETGNYELILKTCKSYNYGIYKVFVDGEEVATYDGYDIKVYALDLSLGKRDIEAGDHVLRLELVGVNPKSIGALISVASITFATERAMPDAPIYTQEVYDTDKVLGAKIYHSENNYDIVLHNRTTGKITAGGVTTNGEQAVIIGQMADGYMEGYTLVAGTSLTFNGKTLVKASSAATVSADFRGKAKYAVTTEKDQSISLYVPYEVVGATVDGKSVKYSVDGNIAKVSVPAGTHTVQLNVIGAVEYLWGHESGSGKALYDENGVLTYKYWKDIDGTEYLYEDGQVKINAYYDAKSKVLIREELLEDGSWQVTTYDLIGNIAKIEIQHPNGNVTLIKYLTDGSISTTVTDSKGNNLEMTMEYKDGSKTVAQYLDDKTVTTKYDANGNVLAVTTMYNDGRRVEENYDENGKLLSKITRSKGGNREEVVYNADGSVVTTIYTANKLTSIQTVNADGTSILEEHLEDGSVRVTKYDKDGNVLEVTIDGKPVEEEKADNSWIIIVIVAVAVVGVAALVIVLVKIKKRNGAASAE